MNELTKVESLMRRKYNITQINKYNSTQTNSIQYNKIRRMFTKYCLPLRLLNEKSILGRQKVLDGFDEIFIGSLHESEEGKMSIGFN